MRVAFSIRCLHSFTLRGDSPSLQLPPSSFEGRVSCPLSSDQNHFGFGDPEMDRVGHGAPGSAIRSRSDDERVAGEERRSVFSRSNPNVWLCAVTNAPKTGLNDSKQGTKQVGGEVVATAHQKHTCFHRQPGKRNQSIDHATFEGTVDGRRRIVIGCSYQRRRHDRQNVNRWWSRC